MLKLELGTQQKLPRYVTGAHRPSREDDVLASDVKETDRLSTTNTGRAWLHIALMNPKTPLAHLSPHLRSQAIAFPVFSSCLFSATLRAVI